MSSRQFKNRSKRFSIEDAFEEDADDAIRIYGATIERSPLQSVEPLDKHADCEVRIQDPLSISEERNNPYRGILSVPSNTDAVSRDSDSLLQRDYHSNRDGEIIYNGWWWCHPKVKENWQVVTGAFALFILGSVLIIAGIIVEVVPIEYVSGIVLLITGLICFIPGVYHVIFIIFAVQGRPGFDFYSLPLFN